MRGPKHQIDDRQLTKIEAVEDRSELLRLWPTYFGQIPVPNRISTGMLKRSIAYRHQEMVLGGLKPRLKRLLVSAAELNAGSEGSARAPLIESGTRLIREWRGQVYEVLVLSDGVQMNGRTYRSLTEVAREITGVHWSGPRFFGLNTAKAHSGCGVAV